MVRKAQNSNKQFLLGTASLAFAVLCVVFIFISLCYDKKQELMEKQSGDKYRIELVKGFKGDTVVVCINDSLLWHDRVTSDTLVLEVNRFAEQNMLMVDSSVDSITSAFNLENKGARLIIRKQQQTISMTAIEW